MRAVPRIQFCARRQMRLKQRGIHPPIQQKQIAPRGGEKSACHELSITIPRVDAKTFTLGDDTDTLWS